MHAFSQRISEEDFDLPAKLLRSTPDVDILAGQSGDDVWVLAPDHQGAIWVCASWGGLYGVTSAVWEPSLHYDVVAQRCIVPLSTVSVSVKGGTLLVRPARSRYILAPGLFVWDSHIGREVCIVLTTTRDDPPRVSTPIAMHSARAWPWCSRSAMHDVIELLENAGGQENLSLSFEPAMTADRPRQKPDNFYSEHPRARTLGYGPRGIV